jgi:hypothetical protein
MQAADYAVANMQVGRAMCAAGTSDAKRCERQGSR